MGRKKDRSQQQRRQEARKRRREKRKDKVRSTAPVAPWPSPMDWDEPTPQVALKPPHPERLLPAVHIDGSGHIVPDPLEILGLGPKPADEATIRAAWRERLVAFPPEQHPDMARQLREARDRLLDPERFLERELGTLQVPDRAKWGLQAEPAAPGSEVLDARARLAASALLYALLEDALWDQGLEEHLYPTSKGKAPQQGSLF